VQTHGFTEEVKQRRAEILFAFSQDLVGGRTSVRRRGIIEWG